MKAATSAAAFCLLALHQVALAAKLRGKDGLSEVVKSNSSKEKTMTKIVRLLEEMLQKSEDAQTDDDKAYAKYKCYCDDNTEEKTKAIEDATKAIGLLENEIGTLQGENGELSIDSASLKQQMDENKQAIATANTLRETERTEFEKFETDMTTSIPMLEQAIQVLGEIGADQTLENSQAHEQFMAGYGNESLVSLDSTVKVALAAATSLEEHGRKMPDKWRRLEALLQESAPLGTTYEVQSGEIVGILREMKMTFEQNLQEARDAEADAIKAQVAFNSTKEGEYTKLETAYNSAQGTLGTNDGTLSNKKTELETETETKADAIDFLAQLEPMCEEKAKEYEKRKLFRTNEQAAISKAIAMLNSDRAYKAFAKVNATSTGATEFVQLSSRVRRASGARDAAAATLRHEVERKLLEAARAKKSAARLFEVAASVAKGNPFTKVIEEINKMIVLIDEEAAQDLEKKTWCEGEQSENGQALSCKQSAINTLKNTDIPTLEDSIDDPDTGFKKVIKEKEELLEENTESMQQETEMRRTENLNYQELANNAAEARELLEKAIEMLEKYYNEAYAGAALAQRTKKGQQDPDPPAPPDTWDNSKIGTETEGKAVVDMLKFVLTETEKEEQSAHETEAAAQAAYEESMGTLKGTEADLQRELATQQGLLAAAEEDLIKKRAELEQTQREKRAIKRYLDEIKPGCDWIIDNYNQRETFRADEKAALNNAITLIEGTPAYANAQQVEQDEQLGDCKGTCEAQGMDTAACLACQARVSVPGYCAGHPGTPGCSGAPAPAP